MELEDHHSKRNVVDGMSCTVYINRSTSACPNMTDQETEDRPVTRRDFNELVQLFKEERAKADADRKERDEERVKADAKKVKIEEERADMQKKWDEGKMLEYALIFFKINQGSPPYKQLLHVKAE